MIILTNTQILDSQDINWWTGVVWITRVLLWWFNQLFGLLFLTAPIHCRASIAEQVIECYISPNLMKKLIYILNGLRESTV